LDTYISTPCVTPRVRKEWRALSDDEKEAWINAVKCLTEHPTSKVTSSGAVLRNLSATWYDDFAYAHTELNNQIHQTGFFLPWHRYFLWSFEQTLRTSCNFTKVIPYWNWSLDASNFPASPFFSPNKTHGLGRFGSPAHDDIVITGAFAHLQLAYPAPHELRRVYTPHPFLKGWGAITIPEPELAANVTFTADEVAKLVNRWRGDFEGFHAHLEGMQGAHMSVHLIMGGDLAGRCPRSVSVETCIADANWSPNEPLFWLHHAMVDKIWSDWQHADPANTWAFAGGATRDLLTWPKYRNGGPPALTLNSHLPASDMLFGNFTIGHVLNTTAGNPLCYVYE
ncbi:Di-copper centre-containing protein, partial [Hysterangium stoloniferum]